MNPIDSRLPDSPLMSVIVPYRNAADHLRQSLPALTAQVFKDAEIILVDNGSTDDSSAFAHEWAVTHPDWRWKLPSESRPGAAAARNRGAAQAEGRWLAFTDADCLPDSNWLADLASAAEAAPAGVVALAGCIRPAPSPSLVARFLGLYTLPPVLVPRTYHAYTLIEGGFPAANLAVRRDAFRAAGGMDETYATAGEDHDFCRRLYAAGHGLQTLVNAVVLHRHRTGLRAMLRQAFQFGSAHARLQKNQPGGACILQMPGFALCRPSRVRVWLDLNQADKKLVVFLILAGIWPPAAILIPVYLLYLAATIRRRAGRRGVTMAWSECAAASLLLVAKSGALTAGRLAGSARHKVVCL